MYALGTDFGFLIEIYVIDYLLNSRIACRDFRSVKWISVQFRGFLNVWIVTGCHIDGFGRTERSFFCR